MPGEPSYSSRWSVMAGANPTFSGTSVRHPYISDTVRKVETILKSEGLRGTRATVVSQTRRGPHRIEGDLTANPSPAMLGFHLVQALGGGTATAPAVADLVPEWGLMADRGTGGYVLGDCYKFLGLKTNRLALSGRASGLVEMTCGVLGKTETSGQTFVGAALGTTLAEEPYSAVDFTLAIDPLGVAVTANPTDWTFTVDNGLTARHTTALAPDMILEGVRSISLTANLVLPGISAINDLYDDVSKNGLTATMTLANSTVSTVFTFAAMQFNRETITRQGNEFILPLRCDIRGTTGVELTVTNDITP